MNRFRLRRTYVTAAAAFSAGWLYYLATPPLASKFYIESGFPLSLSLQSLLLAMDGAIYWAFSGAILASFLIGLSISYLVPFRIKISKLNPRLGVSSYLIAAILLAQIFCYFLLRDSLFLGYGGLSWDQKDPVKSFLSGLNVTLGVVVVANIDLTGSKRWLAIASLAINSIVLLGLGGRMYVLASVLTILFYFIINNRISAKKLAVYATSLLFLMLSVGLLRQGNDLSKEGMLYILVGEPILNWIGGANFWVMNRVGYFEIPYDLTKSILGMVPTAIWPSKAEYLSSLNNNFYIENPVGGTNIIVTLLSNFGYLGSCFATLILGFSTGVLAKICKTNGLARCILAAHLALLTFMFFRDNIGIHQKTLLINSIVIPFILIKATSAMRRLR